MRKTNRAELKEAIARSGISKNTIAKELGITRQALYCKLRGQMEFNESQIKVLVRILDLSPDSVYRILLT